VIVNAGGEPANTAPAKPVMESSPLVVFKARGEEAPTAKVPLTFGNVRVGVPAALCALIVAVPLADPAIPN
jgi:hypothetical protein